MSHDCILPKGLYMSSEKRKFRYESNSQITTSCTQAIQDGPPPSKKKQQIK